MVKKKPKIGALPTLNMPKRSHYTTKPAARPWRSVVNVNPITESSKKYYQSFNDLCKRVKTLKTLNDWIVQELEDRLVLKKKSSQVMLLMQKFRLWLMIVWDSLFMYMDGFYLKTMNCLNVRSTTEHQRKRKPFLAPYRSVDDPRFLWLTNDFLGYLRDWKESTAQRPGNFTQNARSRMFLSWQTYKGLQISAYSVVEATKFLLNEGMEYVLTERFCQDPLEEYFGNQRKLGRRNDNPDMKTFGYNNNTIRVQRAISCQSGNTRGRKDRDRSWVNVSNDSVPKRKKQW